MTIEEKELLSDLLHHEGLPAFWKVADQSLELLNNSVIKFNLDHTNGQQLIILKAEASGAAKLLAALKKRLSKPKP